MRKWLGFLFIAALSTAVFVGCSDDDDEDVLPVARSINVQSPNGGEVWGVGVVNVVSWGVSNVDGNVRIEANYNYPSNDWQSVAASVPASSGSYQWTVASTATEDARVRVVSISYAGVGDTSATSFTIDRCVNDCEQAIPITVGTTHSGCALQQSGPDTLNWYRINNLPAGNYRFRLQDLPQSADFDIYVSNDCGNFAWVHQFLASGPEDTTVAMNAGDYVVMVYRARFGDGQTSPGGSYELIFSNP